MAITIAGYAFEGPFVINVELKHTFGIYVILCWKNGQYSYIDVGESGDIHDRIANHERRPCWVNNCSGQLAIAVLYTPGWTQEQRSTLERRIRSSANFPCGER